MSFLDDVLLWQECKRKVESGEDVGLTMEQKKRLYVVQGSLTTVYFVEGEGSGVVKIGKTGSLQKRIASLQNSSPVKLKLLMTIEYDDDLEGRIHHHLNEYRSHGEWFFACKPVKAFMRGYDEHGLQWLVEQVGDATGHWMNFRRGLPEEMRQSSPRGGHPGFILEEDMRLKI